MPRLTALPLAPLCRAGGHTCAACCYGETVPRPELERRLVRQTALFGWLIGSRQAGRGRLLLHELLSGGLGGLAWALLLLVPVLASLLRPRLRRRRRRAPSWATKTSSGRAWAVCCIPRVTPALTCGGRRRSRCGAASDAGRRDTCVRRLLAMRSRTGASESSSSRRWKGSTGSSTAGGRGRSRSDDEPEIRSPPPVRRRLRVSCQQHAPEQSSNRDLPRPDSDEGPGDANERARNRALPTAGLLVVVHPLDLLHLRRADARNWRTGRRTRSRTRSWTWAVSRPPAGPRRSPCRRSSPSPSPPLCTRRSANPGPGGRGGQQGAVGLLVARHGRTGPARSSPSWRRPSWSRRWNCASSGGSPAVQAGRLGLGGQVPPHARRRGPLADAPEDAQEKPPHP